MFKNILNTLNPNNNNNRPPQRHIVDDDEEDDYVEVTSAADDADEGWEEVMVVKSPTLHTTPITPITPTTVDFVHVAPQTVDLINDSLEVISPVVPVVVVEDPEWLASLKRNNIPYTDPQQGINTYIAAYNGQPYAHGTTGGYPYATPQEGRQYLASIDSPVSYVTSSTVIGKEDTDQAQTPYCVAYHNFYFVFFIVAFIYIFDIL